MRREIYNSALVESLMYEYLSVPAVADSLTDKACSSSPIGLNSHEKRSVCE